MKIGVCNLLKFSCLLLILLSGVVHGQDGGRIAFSILSENGDDSDIVHVNQIEYRLANNAISVISNISVTQRRELRMPPNVAFDRTLVLGNEGQIGQTFNLVLLVDDLQMNFGLNDNIQPFHTVTLMPGEQKRPTLTFPGVAEEGLHNFVLMVFYDIEVSPDSFVRGFLTPYADSLIIGEEDIPDESEARPDGDDFLAGRTVPFSLSVPPRGVNLSRQEEPTVSSDLLSSPQRLSTSQSFPYFAHVRNGVPRQGNSDEFVLVALLDQMQIPVDNRSEDIVSYFTLPNNGLATMPAQLDAPSTPGLHNLDILAIRNPYDFLPRGTSSLEVLHMNLELDVN